MGTWRVEEFGAAGVGGDYADFVGVVEGEVGVDEDEEVGDGGGEGEGWGEKSPCVRVGVEDDGQEGWRGFCELSGQLAMELKELASTWVIVGLPSDVLL